MRIDRRTVVLGVAAAGAVTAAVLVTVSGRDSAGSHERKEVARYIGQVNALQTQMQAPLTRVLVAYSKYGRGRSHKPSPAQLAAAADTLLRLGRKLAALDCPPQASVLRARLLTLIRREAEITREVKLLAGFAPLYVSTLSEVRTASIRLDSQLKKIDVPTPRVLHGTKQAVTRAQHEFTVKAQRAANAQADAIDDYDRTVGRVLKRVVRLRPPPALEPEYHAQVAALHKVTVAGSVLAQGLRAAQRSDVGTLSRRFSLASRAAGTVAVQRAQVAAIRAYNTRARQVGTSAEKVQAEMARLQRDLP